jgi:hypothetical protein
VDVNAKPSMVVVRAGVLPSGLDPQREGGEQNSARTALIFKIPQPTQLIFFLCKITVIQNSTTILLGTSVKMVKPLNKSKHHQTTTNSAMSSELTNYQQPSTPRGASLARRTSVPLPASAATS